MSLLDWAQPAADIGGSLFSSWANYQAQMKTNAQNEKLQREEWDREDTAVQRRMKDLEAAGFNPILAGGDAASSSLAVRMGAPQMANPEIGSAIERGIRSNLARQQVGLTEAQMQTAQAKAAYDRKYWQGMYERADQFVSRDYEVATADITKAQADAVRAQTEADNARVTGRLLEYQDQMNQKYGEANQVLNLIDTALSGAGGLLKLFRPQLNVIPYRKK